MVVNAPLRVPPTVMIKNESPTFAEVKLPRYTTLMVPATAALPVTCMAS